MTYKSIFLGGLAALIALTFFFGSCNKESNPSTINKPPTESFGTFRVSLIGDENRTSIVGAINDGPTPPSIIYEKLMTVNKCSLYKTLHPSCEPSCGIDGACVAKDSCQPYPNAIDAGTVTVNGLKIANVKTPFTMDFIVVGYQPVVTVDFPPFSEGDTITLAAAGKGTMPPFTLMARGISPLALHNDSVPCGDHQPIDLQWTKATIPGISTIFVFIDISYHGGSKGKIECDCEDNGSLTVAASLMDSLKSFGISGFPKVEVTRITTGANETAKAQIVIESMVRRWISIPGIITCNNDTQCPEGYHCGGDQRCYQN